jgi:hypothetical protein
LAAEFRIGACPEPPLAELDLGRSEILAECLRVRVRHHEVDAVQARADHGVDRVPAGTADSHYFDLCLQVSLPFECNHLPTPLFE